MANDKMELFPISTVAENVTPERKESPDAENPEQQPLLVNTNGPMENVKSVLHEGGKVRIVSKTTPATSAPVKNGNPQNHDEEPDGAPRDRYNIVFIILVIHGIGTLMPWNMFINAKTFFTEYKLTTTNANGSREDSVYKEHFLSYIGVASQLPNFLFNVLNLFVQFGGSNLTYRIIGSIVIEILIMVATVVLTIVDTSNWVDVFFYVTMALVVMLNVVNGIFQNSIYGLAAKLPMRYANAVILGSNISGTFVSLVNILTIWMSPNMRIAAVYYFVAAIVVLLVCFDTYLALPLNKFFRHYIQPDTSSSKSGECKEIRKGSKSESSSKRPPFLLIFKHCWKQCVNVFLVFFVTLSIFPVLHSSIEPVDPKYFGSEENTKLYFTAVSAFLVFNASAMIGNIIPAFIRVPGPDRLWIPVVARLLFIPFFLFCNLNPEARAWPVYIQSDSLMILGGTLLGLSSGYLSSLCMMYAPGSTPTEYAGIAGMMAGVFLVSGIFFGINFSSFLFWANKQHLGG